MSDYWCVLTSIGTGVISWFVTSRIKSADKLNDCITLIKKDADALATHGSCYWTPTSTPEERIETVVEIRIKYDSLSDQIDGLRKYTYKNNSETRNAANMLYGAITGGDYQSATFKPNNAIIKDIRLYRTRLNDELNKIKLLIFLY